MKKQVMSLVALIVLATTTCMAQDQQRGPRGGDPVDRMKTELGLSDEQATQLKEVFAQMRPQKPGEQNGKTAEKRERPSEEQMKKQREEMNAKVKKILTSEQYTKFEQMQQRQRPERPQQKEK